MTASLRSGRGGSGVSASRQSGTASEGGFKRAFEFYSISATGTGARSRSTKYMSISPRHPSGFIAEYLLEGACVVDAPADFIPEREDLALGALEEASAGRGGAAGQNGGQKESDEFHATSLMDESQGSKWSRKAEPTCSANQEMARNHSAGKRPPLPRPSHPQRARGHPRCPSPCSFAESHPSRAIPPLPAPVPKPPPPSDRAEFREPFAGALQRVSGEGPSRRSRKPSTRSSPISGSARPGRRRRMFAIVPCPDAAWRTEQATR